jgi:hypothetical protein
LAAFLQLFCSIFAEINGGVLVDKFNISEYISIVKKAFVSMSAQGPAGIALMECIGSLLVPEIRYDDTKVTRLVKHANEAPDEMVRAVSDPSFVMKVYNQFKISCEPDLNIMTIDNVCLKLINLINNEHSLASTYKSNLNSAYSATNKSWFLVLALCHAITMSNTNSSKTTTSDEVPYLIEAKNNCPNCGSQLIKSARGRNICSYGITKIFDEMFDEEIKRELISIYPAPLRTEIVENKIALCVNCYSDYRANPTQSMYKKLFDKKRSFERQAKIDSELNDLDVEDELYTIIQDLGELTKSQEAGLLPLDPKEVIEKIPEDVVLKDTVQYNVLKYYKYVEKQFSNLDSSGTSRFKVIASQVNLAYETLDARHDMDQKEIFNRLAFWVADQLGYPHEKISVVFIMIAFFVQNCEVFHAIS